MACRRATRIKLFFPILGVEEEVADPVQVTELLLVWET
jgi:hypothetical protein